ncbi:hypothetical protein N7541_006261 [Penicillium brevicompactum]|uniref:Uncharacterized protein n=1 Tax=Penicillium brevicompactum TaxID=5074 RepID=A0A9W9UQM3_PENBR|nr:hypothetical protein N7541_006261 [Penicillium brevicompactum]
MQPLLNIESKQAAGTAGVAVARLVAQLLALLCVLLSTDPPKALEGSYLDVAGNGVTVTAATTAGANTNASNGAANSTTFSAADDLDRIVLRSLPGVTIPLFLISAKLAGEGRDQSSTQKSESETHFGKAFLFE